MASSFINCLCFLYLQCWGVITLNLQSDCLNPIMCWFWLFLCSSNVHKIWHRLSLTVTTFDHRCGTRTHILVPHKHSEGRKSQLMARLDTSFVETARHIVCELIFLIFKSWTAKWRWGERGLHSLSSVSCSRTLTGEKTNLKINGWLAFVEYQCHLGTWTICLHPSHIEDFVQVCFYLYRWLL